MRYSVTLNGCSEAEAQAWIASMTAAGHVVSALAAIPMPVSSNSKPAVTAPSGFPTSQPQPQHTPNTAPVSMPAFLSEAKPQRFNTGLLIAKDAETGLSWWQHTKAGASMYGTPIQAGEWRTNRGSKRLPLWVAVADRPRLMAEMATAAKA